MIGEIKIANLCKRKKGIQRDGEGRVDPGGFTVLC